MADKPPSSGEPSKRRIGPLFLVLILVVGAAGAFFLFRDRLNLGGGGAGIETKVALVERKNVALGELENERMYKAIESLSAIVAEAPDDPFGPRNLAVARLLDLEKQQKADAEAYGEKQKAANAAVAALLNIPGQEAYAHWIDARIQKLDQDEAGQLASLEAAAKLLPKEVALWHEIYRVGNVSADDASRERASQALAKCYELAPDNYAVLLDWLLVQATAQDPTIDETLTKAKETLRPLAEVIKLRLNVDVVALIDKAKELVAAGEWQRASIEIRKIGNVVRPDESQISDVRRLDMHPLSFMLFDFEPDFYTGWEADLAPAKDEAIKFTAKPLELAGPNMPTAAGVSGVWITDFDLDGINDLLLVRTGFAEAYRRDEGDPAAPKWELITSAAIPEGLTNLIAADLYRTEETGRPTKKFVTAPKSGDPPGTPEANAPGSEASNLIQNEAPPNPGCQDTFQGLIVFGEKGLRILRFDPIDKPAGEQLSIVDQTDELENLTEVSKVAPIDFDNDGDLDLAVLAGGKVSLWLNRSEGTFSPASSWSSMPGDDLAFTDMAVVDFDRDVDLDIVLTGPGAGALGHLENLRHGQFRWRELSDKNYDLLRGAEAIRAAEIDGNASWDLVAAGKDGLSLALTASPRAGDVVEYGSGRIPGVTSASQLALWDYNNDAFLDALVLDDGKLAIFSGEDGAVAFADGKIEAGLKLNSQALREAPNKIVDFDVGDLDGDGDLDIVCLRPDGLTLLQNEGGNANHWIHVKALGQSDNVTGRANHYGLGSLMELRTKTRYQAQTVERQTTHFGLGQESPADALRILWTTGIPQARIEPEQDHLFCEPMLLKGSCPYLYTWTGERFEFFTDLLWAAPLGLQQAEGVLAPCRFWEYLKIPGEKLAMKDGAYELQVTCELWEADYFDQVELIAIDHPADVEIYSNEKVGPAEIAEFKVHTVKNRRAPVAARDKAGRDVLPLVAAADGRYMQGFERTFRQGLTEEHYMELDLGEFEGEQATLFLTGWIRPTDTSINISLSQDPTLEGPRPPYLLAPDANGEWREVRPFMGFPGGKPKTIAIDLAGVFTSDDHRLRIATSNEIYWDEAFFTVDESVEETRVTPLKLLSADLHYRGFSLVRPWQATQPETYDYSFVETAPKWPPMAGKFTRYGDVKELLTTTDNRLAIMSSGDETTLRFAPPSDPLPPGWKRDFFLHSRGWDKDADLNTIHGQTVEPLPFAEMKSYPYEPNESYPDTLELRAWQEEYQTREVDPNRYWKQILRDKH